ncbi:MAG: hypothetical protein OEW11_11425 [Nitrospirota bacterium]|nr:hypothetical protein [Nitrospirota bacterium]
MKTIFNSTASKAVFTIAVAAVAGLVAAGCGSDSAAGIPGAPVVGLSNQAFDLTWSTTLAAQLEIFIAVGTPVSTAQLAVGDANNTYGFAINYSDQSVLKAACEKEKLSYDAAQLVSLGGKYPNSITYTSAWTDAVGVANCTTDGFATWTTMSGNTSGTLVGLGNTLAADLLGTGLTGEYLKATVGSWEDYKLDGANDRRGEKGHSYTATVAYGSGLPVDGSLTGFDWTRNRDGGNWFSTTTVVDPNFDWLQGVTYNNVTWATTLGVTTYNGSYRVSSGSNPVGPGNSSGGYFDVTLTNVTQNDVCAGGASQPDGGKITISNGVAAQEIVIDMTDASLSYNLAPPTTLDCGSAVVTHGGTAAAGNPLVLFTGPAIN